MAVADIIEQHADEAAFLWRTRSAAAGGPNYTLSDLAAFDDRIEAHLDGLRVAGPPGTEIAASMADDEAGCVFVLGVLALEQTDRDLYAQALALTEASDDHAQAFVSALSWLPPASTTAPREHLIRASGTHQRHLGLRAALALREDVGPLLPKALDDDDGSLRRIALRAAGLLGRTDLLRTLEGHRESATSDEAFLAAWSGGRMGDHDAVLALLDGIRTHAPRTGDALDVVVRRLEVPDAQDLVRHLMGQDDRQRDAIMATGILGDPAAIPWLIDRFEDLSTARLAGDAFSLITGADLVDLNLDRDPPEDVESGPTDDPDDDDVDMDADDTLPWPDRDRIAAWWSAEQGTFTKGVRHLLGSPIDAVSARDALLRGTQRQRSAAALELAILLPNRPVFNTALPARTQRAQLASRTAL